MYQDLNMFTTAGAMAQHAGTRQAAVASNIANADTPGFEARQIASFRDTFAANNVGEMHATRDGHLGRESVRMRADATKSLSEPSPNGNTVSVEDEILMSVDVSREHSRALAIYRHSMTVLRSSLGRN